jgi:competence protein ComEC
VCGLLAGPRAPALVLVLAIVIVPMAGRPLLALAAVGALLGGATVAQARLVALDRSSLLGSRLGHAASARVTLLEPMRRLAYGTQEAVVGWGRERVLLQAPGRVRWPAVEVGAELRVRGVVERLRPGQGWLRVRSVHAALVADEVAATGRVRGGLLGRIDRIRMRADRALAGDLPPPQSALFRGMALGHDEALPEDLRDDFRAAGLSHLVAASGQNVMLLATLVLGTCALLGVSLRLRLALVMALVALYVPLAGAGPSIQRAGVMGGAGVLATMVGRPAARWYALLLAAAVTLTLNPRAVEDAGWQLSFAAVLAILVLASPLQQALRARRMPGGLAEAVALTTAATIGTAPLIALHFGRTSLVALPANVLAAPVVAPIMWLGMLAGALGQLGPGLAAPLDALAGPALAYLTWLGHAAAAAPGAQVGAPPLVVASACAGVAAAVVSRRARRLAPLVALGALALALALARPPDSVAAPPAVARVTFLDVGQGDAILLQDRSAAVLFDTGPPDGGIVARLRHAGVRRLDLLVVTHAQADHDGGAAAVLAAVPVSLLLDGRDGRREPLGARMATEAARRGVRRVAPVAGEVLRAGTITIRVLWPAPEPGAGRVEADPNLRAVVAEAEVGGLRVLLTADAESDVLARLDLDPVDVLKVSHHGSDDPGLPGVLARLRPRLAAIEVGRHNTYGHPTESTLAALRRAGATVYRTDRDGTVRLEPEGRALRVQVHA